MRRGRKIAKVVVARDWQFVCTECEGMGATVACVIDAWFRHLLWNHVLPDSKEKPLQTSDGLAAPQSKDLIRSKQPSPYS